MGQKKHFPTITWIYTIGIILLFLMAAFYLVLGQFGEKEPEMDIVPKNTYSETIVVAMDLDYQPYSFYAADGKPSGYDVELIYHLANVMEKNVEVRLMSWVEAQAAVQSGEADVLMGLDYNVESLQEYELSMPLDNDPFVAFGKEKLSQIDEFYNKRIATLDGSGSFAAFLKPYQLEAQTQTYDSYTEAFESVERGENDYAIAMYSVGRRAIANLDNSQMKAVGPILAGNYLCIGTKKGNTALIEELNQAIILLKRQGVADDLGEKWLGRYIQIISVQDFLKQYLVLLILFGAIILLGIALIYGIINRRLAKSTAMQHEMTKRVLDYQQIMAEAAKGLYDSIYEVNVTKNCIEGDSTRQYFEKLGIPHHTPFDEALKWIAETQVEPGFMQSYVETFCTANIQKAYDQGIDRIRYEFRLCDGTNEYYWMRITACIFRWIEDDTLHMITYRVNIDDEKKKEQTLEEKVRVDALTGLYNKVTTNELIRAALAQKTECQWAFIMLDIDDFKEVNDNWGHGFGDFAIAEFANEVKHSAENLKDVIIGRVGGDEFTVFFAFENRSLLEEWVAQFVRSLRKEIKAHGKSCYISCSVGVAICPYHGTDFETLYHSADMALYQTKNNGKNGYKFYEGETDCK